MYCFVEILVPPAVKAVTNIVSTPSGSHVLLQCIVEVFPKPLNGWHRSDGRNGKLKKKLHILYMNKTLT